MHKLVLFVNKEDKTMFLDTIVISGLVIVALTLVFFGGIGYYAYKQLKKEES